MRPGLRSDYKPYGSHEWDWYLLDWNFHSDRGWPRHERLAMRYRPALAMVPDYFAIKERETRLLQHWHIEQLDIRPIWCPKFHGAEKDIPANAVIGISVPTDYAGFLPRPEAVAGRELHLLGGDPDAQRYLMERIYTASHVVSVDGNTLALKAGHGMYWSAALGRWIQTPPRKYSNAHLELRSARQIVRYWERDRVNFNMKRKPIQRIMEAL